MTKLLTACVNFNAITEQQICKEIIMAILSSLKVLSEDCCSGIDQKTSSNRSMRATLPYIHKQYKYKIAVLNIHNYV